DLQHRGVWGIHQSAYETNHGASDLESNGRFRHGALEDSARRAFHAGARQMKRVRGFSVIETVIVLSLFAVVATVLAAVTIDTSRLAKTITVQEKMQHQSRHQLDVLMRDIRDAQYVLTSYTSGATTYQSNTTGTLILQAPSYDSSGNILASNDVMVYDLVGSSAPYTLNRLVV